MTTLASDTFTGTDGDAWSSTWTTGQTPTGATATIQSNAGRLVCGTVGGYAGASRVSRRANITSPTDAVVKCRIRFPGTEVYPQIYVRSTNNAIDTQGGYRISLNRPAGQWEVGKVSGYTQTALQTATSFTYSSATWYWVIFGVVGTSIKFLQWLDGDPVPTTWLYEGTDATITAAGPVGFTVGVGAVGNGQFEIDDVTIDDVFPTLVVSGSAALSGSGALSNTGVPTPIQTDNQSGSGTLSFAGTPAASSAGVLSGSGTLASTGSPGVSQIDSLSGAGTLALTGTPSPVVTDSLSATGTLVVTGTTTSAGSLGTSGAGSLALQGTPGSVQSTNYSGSGTLTLSAKPTFIQTTALSGSGTATETAKPGVSGATTLDSVGALGISAGTVVGGGATVTAGRGRGGLISFLYEAAETANYERTRIPTACPNDGEPLTSGPNGELFCLFDGWSYK